jgi:hypothetical protein
LQVSKALGYEKKLQRRFAPMFPAALPRTTRPVCSGLGGRFERNTHYIELRVKSAGIFYCFKPGGVIVLLHGFTKKSQRTPHRELQIASIRMTEV